MRDTRYEAGEEARYEVDAGNVHVAVERRQRHGESGIACRMDGIDCRRLFLLY